MTKKTDLIFIICLSLSVFGCQSAPPTTNEAKAESSPTPKASASIIQAPNTIEVPKLANKPAAELDKIFGPPEKITPATMAKEIPGEYRLYKMAGHPKGLSVRFYKDKAVRFNLLLGTPEKSSREALLKYFGIDVSKMSPDKSESLSETWKGNLNGINFTTAYAKREKEGSDFVMIHAEIAQ